MPAFDAALMFKSNTNNLTRAVGTFPSAGLKIRGTPISGLAAKIIIPEWPGTTVKLAMNVQGSMEDTTYRTVASYPLGAQCRLSSAAAEVLMVPFTLPADVPYVKLNFAITGGTTGTSWGAVKAGIVPIGGSDWERAGIVAR